MTITALLYAMEVRRVIARFQLSTPLSSWLAREDTKMGIREEHAEIHATVCNRLGQRKFKRFAYVPVGSEFRVGPCGSVTFKKLNEDEAIRVDGNGYRTKFELDARCTYPWPPTAGEPMVTCPQCEGTPDLCNGYCEGNGMVTTNHAAEWRRQNREPQAGKTLADFANSGKLFKRPMHANPHGFTAGSDYLREIRTSNWQGQHNVIADFPRLTREDLTATDWQEVTGEV